MVNINASQERKPIEKPVQNNIYYNMIKIIYLTLHKS